MRSQSETFVFKLLWCSADGAIFSCTSKYDTTQNFCSLTVSRFENCQLLRETTQNAIIQVNPCQIRVFSMGHVFSRAIEERSLLGTRHMIGLLGTRHLMIGSTGNSEFSFRENIICLTLAGTQTCRGSRCTT